MKWVRDYRRFDYCQPGELLSGLDGMVHAAIGAWRRRPGVRARLKRQVGQILAIEERWTAMSQTELTERLGDLRSAFRRGGKEIETNLVEALAALREAAFRATGLRAFPVQMLGALALQRGHLVEMGTGEGKTLVAGMAAVLAGWTGKPCFVVTVNDYLVRRDADWLRPLYRICGVSVGEVTGKSQPEERRSAYSADVTYGTSKEFLGDFLRDLLRTSKVKQPARRLLRQLLPGANLRDQTVMRGLHTAIVDEADSVLIDEAVTPLIISAPKKNESLNNVVSIASKMIEGLESGWDYRMDERYREIELTDAGRQKIAAKSGDLPGIWQGTQRRDEVVKQALTAREFFQSGKQYVVQKNKVVIVDEFTGRAMPGRSWSQGLHQAVEAKEGVELTDANETIARMSFQRFFRQFRKLSGMTGTGKESTSEFWRVYELPVVRIPPNKPSQRRLEPERFFVTEDQKWAAVLETIRLAHATGGPVLVGTRSVHASDKVAQELGESGLACRLLNAVNDSHEAGIIKEAGQLNKITVATNMAGRGTDIRLGSEVFDQGLFVIATERHESGRVDRQLIGRAGRQGDPGRAQLFVSAEDELLRKYLHPSIIWTASTALKSGLPGAKWMMKSVVHLAQYIAQKQAAKARSKVLKADRWLDSALSFTGK